MDQVDVANDQALDETARALDNMKRSFVKMQPNGMCRYCEDSVSNDRLFCDSWCRDQYENEQRQLRQMGRLPIR